MDEKEKDLSQDMEIGYAEIYDTVEKVALQTPGVWRLSSRFYDEVVEGITEKFGAKRKPGIGIKRNKTTCEISLYIITGLDRNFIDLAKEIQTRVKESLWDAFAIEATQVNVSIEGVHLEEEK